MRMPTASSLIKLNINEYGNKSQRARSAQRVLMRRRTKMNKQQTNVLKKRRKYDRNGEERRKDNYLNFYPNSCNPYPAYLSAIFTSMLNE